MLPFPTLKIVSNSIPLIIRNITILYLMDCLLFLIYLSTTNCNILELE